MGLIKGNAKYGIPTFLPLPPHNTHRNFPPSPKLSPYDNIISELIWYFNTSLLHKDCEHIQIYVNYLVTVSIISIQHL